MFRYVGQEFFKDKPDLLEEYKLLANKIGNTYSRRNEIEHATWQHFGTKEAPSISVRILRNSSIEPQFKSAQDVDVIAQDIIKLVMELDGFMQKNISTPKSSQDKSS